MVFIYRSSGLRETKVPRVSVSDYRLSSKEPAPAPLLGQHNFEVYEKYLGYCPAEILPSKERGVI